MQTQKDFVPIRDMTTVDLGILKCSYAWSYLLLTAIVVARKHKCGKDTTDHPHIFLTIGGTAVRRTDTMVSASGLKIEVVAGTAVGEYHTAIPPIVGILHWIQTHRVVICRQTAKDNATGTAVPGRLTKKIDQEIATSRRHYTKSYYSCSNGLKLVLTSCAKGGKPQSRRLLYIKLPRLQTTLL